MTATVKMGDYTLVKEIGQGSMGSVFLAEHRFLKKPFVLKVLPEAFSSDRSFAQRLEKEIAALTGLDHPHIVKMHNVSFADGKYFLVTDCIVDDYGETTTLGQYLATQHGALSEDEVITIATQIASALDHAKPLVHGGLKLNNVLVGKAEDGIHVYLSDFGLTKVLGPDFFLSRTYAAIAKLIGKSHEIGSGAEHLKQLHNSFLQNFAFLAPEQKAWNEGRAEQHREDTFAFGVLIYYLLMRKAPEGVFELPSTHFPHHKYNWDDLILSCLQESPKARPDSLVKALTEITQGTNQTSAPSFKSSTSQGHSNRPRPVLKPSELTKPDYEDDPSAIFQIETSVSTYKPKQNDSKSIEPILTEMVVVPGGAYYRGSQRGARDEIPRHQITLESFAIDIHPVTNEQFVRFLMAMGGEKDGNNNDIIRLRDSRIKRSAGKLSIESGYSKHPVVGVSWYGAMAYAKWVGKRLPTEAEWEIAARGGSEESMYPTGENIERPQANFFNSDTTAVMSYPPNGYGLYDNAGNVYEWCQDWYSYQYYDISMQEPDNPQGPLQGVYRVLRGGCWKSLKEDLRCAHRHRNNPGTMNRTYGFRCATAVR